MPRKRMKKMEKLVKGVNWHLWALFYQDSKDRKKNPDEYVTSLKEAREQAISGDRAQRVKATVYRGTALRSTGAWYAWAPINELALYRHAKGNFTAKDVEKFGRIVKVKFTCVGDRKSVFKN